MNPPGDPHLDPRTVGFDPRRATPAAGGSGMGGVGPMGSAYPPGLAPSDTLLTITFWAFTMIAAAVVALPALIITAAAYPLAAWRGWRWWRITLTGLAVIAITMAGGWALSGHPAGAVTWHALRLRELFANPAHGPAIGELARHRWAAWLLHELPLSVGAALLAVGLIVEHIGSSPAHELSPTAQQRRRRHAHHRTTRAQKTAVAAPLTTGRTDRPVLGAWIEGDLPGWRTGRWTTIPPAALGLGTVLVGLPGAGKTETLLRLAEIALDGGWDVHIIDAKGDPATANRFTALCADHNVATKRFPDEPYDGWRGDPAALRNRLSRVIDYTEPYYADGARDLLAHICDHPGGPPRSLPALLAAIAAVELEGLDPAVRRGTLARYRAFNAAAAGSLDGHWAYEDTQASYLLLDGVALGDDAPRLARFLVEDFAHYAAVRKTPDRKTLLLVDEFSAIRLPNAAALVERLRSFGAGIVIAAQSPEALHDDAREADRLLATAATLIAHRIANPDPIVTRAGTTKRAERSHQLNGTLATGAGSLRMQDTYRIDPNDLRSLPPGLAWIVHGGHATKTAITRSAATRRLAPLPHPAPIPQNQHESFIINCQPDAEVNTEARRDPEPKPAPISTSFANDDL
jgi:hypothetical protein